MTPLVVPAVDVPLLSVVVVTYGGWDFVRDALQSLIDNTPPCYELIVVDNASPDGTGAQVAAGIEGATVVLNETNLGFGAASNQAALHARGRYLCFLNSDAFVQEGWLPPLLAAFDADPAVAAATPRVLDPDGSLQEAGGIIGSDGYAGQLGLHGDADAPEFRFPRQVDYCSAVCLVIRRHDFLGVGGFDPAYGIGYFEDVDLCYALWDRGRATVYVPESRVVHLRGASSDPERARRLATASQAVFARRWSHVTARRPALGDPAVRPLRANAARDARIPDRVLLLGAGGAGGGALLEDLVDLLPGARLSVLPTEPVAGDRLLALGVEVAPVEGQEAWLEARPFHYSVVITQGPDAFGAHEGLLRATQPQALFLHAVEALDFRMADSVPPGAASPHRLAALAAEGARQRDGELRAIARAGAVLCSTEDEAAIVRRVDPATAVHLLAPALEPGADPPGFDARRGVVLPPGDATGSSPSDDAVDHGRHDVLPALLRRDEGLPVHAGDLDGARLLLAPFRVSWSLPPALLEAAAAGLPFVTTPVGAAGLPLGDLAPLVVGTGPDELVERAWALLTDRGRWEEVQAGLLAMARAEFAPATRRRRLVEVLAGAGLAPRPASPLLVAAGVVAAGVVDR